LLQTVWIEVAGLELYSADTPELLWTVKLMQTMASFVVIIAYLKFKKSKVFSQSLVIATTISAIVS